MAGHADVDQGGGREPRTGHLPTARPLGSARLTAGPGHDDLRYRLGLGADRDVSRRILDTYLDRGGNFVDTANTHTGGTSERYLGEFLADRRERVVLATKYTCVSERGNPNSGGNHRRSMVRSVEASLRRLDTDDIDLLYLHAWDGTTPVEEILRGLDDLVRSGKVVYVGMSDVPAWRTTWARSTSGSPTRS